MNAAGCVLAPQAFNPLPVLVRMEPRITPKR
jgi:hypothetical protein